MLGEVIAPERVEVDEALAFIKDAFEGAERRFKGVDSQKEQRILRVIFERCSGIKLSRDRLNLIWGIGLDSVEMDIWDPLHFGRAGVKVTYGNKEDGEISGKGYTSPHIKANYLLFFNVAGMTGISIEEGEPGDCTRSSGTISLWIDEEGYIGICAHPVYAWTRVKNN